jgi:hypothetical protein
MTVPKLFRDAMIICAITIALLVLAEAGLRLLIPQKRTEVRGSKPDVAYVFDDDYLIALKPNLRRSFTRAKVNGGITVKWETNSDGFRGNELRRQPDIRVMVYGDSSIQAEFSNLEDTFPFRLEKYLAAGLPGYDIEVVNAGVIGFGPDQSLIKLSKEADRYKPSLIIFHVFATNDFGDIIRNRLFDLGPDGNLVATQFERTKDELLIDATSKRQGRIRAFISSLLFKRVAERIGARIRIALKKSPTAQDTIDFYISLADNEYDVYRRSQPRRFSHFADHDDLDVAIYPRAESSRTKIRLMAAVLREVKRFTTAKGIELLVLIQPSAVDLTENCLLSYKDLERYPEYKRTNLTSVIEEACIAAGIQHINLFETFIGNHPESLYFSTFDRHWNDRGQELAARTTATYILENMWPGKSTSSAGRAMRAARQSIGATYK